jgi:hypothetical protein
VVWSLELPARWLGLTFCFDCLLCGLGSIAHPLGPQSPGPETGEHGVCLLGLVRSSPLLSWWGALSHVDVSVLIAPQVAWVS